MGVDRGGDEGAGVGWLIDGMSFMGEDFDRSVFAIFLLYTIHDHLPWYFTPISSSARDMKIPQLLS